MGAIGGHRGNQVRALGAGHLRAGLLFCFRGPSDACCVTRTAWGPVVGAETFIVLFSTQPVYVSLGCGLFAHLDLHLAWTKALLPCAPSLPDLGPHPVPSGRPNVTGNRKEIAVPILRGRLECQS